MKKENHPLFGRQRKEVQVKEWGELCVYLINNNDNDVLLMSMLQ